MGMNEISSENILIITSCLYPNKITTDFKSVIGSLEKRINRYIYTVEQLKIKRFDKAYFIDNSKYKIRDFPKLHEILKLKNIEIINIKPSKYSYQRGKGFQETEMIDYILKNHDCNTNFFKITGTIPLTNLHKLTTIFQRLMQINDKRLFSSKISYINKTIDTRFFYTNKKTWEVFIENYRKFIDEKNNIYIEHLLFFFCELRKIKLNLFYPKTGKKIFVDGNGKRYNYSKMEYLLNKLSLY